MKTSVCDTEVLTCDTCARGRDIEDGGSLHTFKLLLSRLGVAAGAVEIVSSSANGSDAEVHGHS